MLTDEEALTLSKEVVDYKTKSHVAAARLLALYILSDSARVTPSRADGGVAGNSSGVRTGLSHLSPETACPAPPGTQPLGAPSGFDDEEPSTKDRFLNLPLDGTEGELIARWLEEHAAGYTHAGEHTIASVLRKKAHGIRLREHYR